jgi:predicted flap endonuclease-1-like 5' DNA nuclease
MTWLIEEQSVSAARERAEKALRIPLGMASPLWLAFGAATSVGVTWWWMTRWTKAVNLEAMAPFRLASPVLAVVEETAPAIEVVVEASPEPVARVVAPAVAVETSSSPEPKAVSPVAKAESAKTEARKAAAAAKSALKARSSPVAAKTAAQAQAKAVAPKAPSAPKVGTEAATAAEPAPSSESKAVAPAIPTVEAAPLETAKAPTPHAKSASAPNPVAKPPAEPDDLTRLVGVGAKLADSLAARGVTRFSQIAAWTGDDLARFDAELSLKGRAARDSWVAQAKRFARARN